MSTFYCFFSVTWVGKMCKTGVGTAALEVFSRESAPYLRRGQKEASDNARLAACPVAFTLRSTCQSTTWLQNFSKVGEEACGLTEIFVIPMFLL